MKYLISLILTASVFFAFSVQSQPVAPKNHLWSVTCMATESLNKKLSDEFGEQLIMRGEGVNNDHFEIWATKDGNFTIVLSPFEGMSSISFFGEGLRLMGAKEQEL